MRSRRVQYSSGEMKSWTSAPLYVSGWCPCCLNGHCRDSKSPLTAGRGTQQAEACRVAMQRLHQAKIAARNIYAVMSAVFRHVCSRLLFRLLKSVWGHRAQHVKRLNSSIQGLMTLRCEGGCTTKAASCMGHCARSCELLRRRHLAPGTATTHLP